MKKKEILLKKNLEEVYVLLKDNDLITRKFREKGQNVTQYRDYIKKSKNIADKISQQQGKKMTTMLLNNSLLKLQEVKKGNLKIKEKFLKKIKSIELKKGEKVIKVEPPKENKKRNSIFPSED